MNKLDQLERAKHLANVFLYLPVEPTAFGFAVMHPFLECGVVFDGEQIFNVFEDKEKFVDYLKKFEETGIGKCENISDLLWLVRKSYRLTFLSYLRKDRIISLRECGNLLAEQWTTIENICADTNVQKRSILSWAKAADKSCFMEEKDYEVYNGLPDVVTVYRGCETPKAVNGMSWTLSKDKACWFAQRFLQNKEGFIYRAQIRKEDVICYLNSRNEDEIVLDYQKLKDVESI